MSKTERNGIKFPFTTESIHNTYIDLNIDSLDSVRSELIHLIFTPFGQRLRNPRFGSKLIQYIFSPNDSQTWDSIVMEIKDMVSLNIPDCEIENIRVYDVDNGLGLVAEIKYQVIRNGNIKKDTIITNL